MSIIYIGIHNMYRTCIESCTIDERVINVIEFIMNGLSPNNDINKLYNPTDRTFGFEIQVKIRDKMFYSIVYQESLGNKAASEILDDIISQSKNMLVENFNERKSLDEFLMQFFCGSGSI